MATENVHSGKIVEVAFFSTAVLFISSLLYSPYPGDAVLKVLPIACLIWLVLEAPGGWRRNTVVLALLFCAVGDISLELNYFVSGLSAFLLGHICYLLVFCKALVISRWRLVCVVLVVCSSAAMADYLGPHLGDMVMPVYAYTTVITSMVIAALIGRYNHIAVIIGSILFVLSDSLIAINRFVEPMAESRYWIMLLYYAAQYLLTYDARKGNYTSS